MLTSSSSARQCGENFWDPTRDARTYDHAGCALSSRGCHASKRIRQHRVLAPVLRGAVNARRRRHSWYADIPSARWRSRRGRCGRGERARSPASRHRAMTDGPARFDVVRVGSGSRARQTGPTHLVRGCGRRADRRVCQRRQSVACPRPHAVIGIEIRRAAGASRRRIVFTNVTESIVLSVIRRWRGTVIATAGVQVVKPLAVYGLPRRFEVLGARSSIAASCRALTK